VPAALQAQLKAGGRLVAIEGQEPVMRAVVLTRMAEQQFKRVELFDTAAPRLDGFAEPTRFHF
jgi:protein-L-isoaspartate(D-aspartate) O-methyltransferase